MLRLSSYHRTRDGSVPGEAPDLTRFDVVVPTVGRPCLGRLLEALARSSGMLPERIVLVDDRLRPTTPLLPDPLPALLKTRTEIVSSGGRGPAAARNTGWRRTSAPWVVFLDDDVVPTESWLSDLQQDLDCDGSAGSQGGLQVPLPPDRRPTDWERNVRGLEQAWWATADMAYRREMLEEVGGFDERFPRAFREDCDLALRLLDRGHQLRRGRRKSWHPIRPAQRWVSLKLARGNRDDPLMWAIHGPDWRRRGHAYRGRRRWHLVTTGAALLALASAITGRRRLAGGAGIAWLGLTVEFAAERIIPGPQTPDELVDMAVTSALLPPLCTYHWLVGVAKSMPIWLERTKSG